jgi:hypothetical protein
MQQRPTISKLFNQNDSANSFTTFESYKIVNAKRIWYRKVVFFLIIANLLFAISSFAQAFFNTTNVTITNSTLISINGDLQSNTNSIFFNNGTITLTEDLINNSGSSLFDTSSGTVALIGNAQTIKGNDQTVFNNLILAGSNDKTLAINTTVGGNYNNPSGQLLIDSVSIHLANHTITVNNPNSSAIQSNNGYIISESTSNQSRLAWHINNNTGPHTIPFANSSKAYIPLTFDLTSGDAGKVEFSTYATSAFNLPMPTSPTVVTHIRNAAGNDNSDNMADRYWEITPNNGGIMADITFTYANSEIPANGNTAMVAQNWNNPLDSWNLPKPGQSKPTPHSVKTTNQISFGTWAVSRDASPLPITLLEFTAVPINNNTVNTQWITVTEINNDYFTLQRSIDGKNYEDLAFIDGAGNSNHTLYYNYVDLQPFMGISYYRLKQTDFNGIISFSEPRPVKLLEKGKFIVEAFPNPTTNLVNIHSNGRNLSLHLVSKEGKSIQQINTFDFATTLNIENLAAGVYYLMVNEPQSGDRKTILITKI